MQVPDDIRVAQGSQSAEAMELEGVSVRFKTYSPELFATLERLKTVAAHQVTVLLVGETGSGKTTLARLIHELSPRHNERFMTVACGAMPGELIESELFGHVKGAFTGADRNKIGRFEVVGKGTLLLDEIDVLSSKEQAKLLRVIETGEFEPVGSNETRRTEARLIVASNVDLATLMDANAFRRDLYYRLNVLEFVIPPLRKRPGDIVPLAVEFIAELAQAHGIVIEAIEADFLDALVHYDWPGNLRELKNHMRRAVLFCRDGRLGLKDLSPMLIEPRETTPSVGQSLADRVALSEREMLERALRSHNYKRTATAESLGISRVGLYKKMRKYGMLDGRSAFGPSALPQS